MIDRDGFAKRVLALNASQYRIAWSILKNDADCGDAMQEALLKAWASRHSLRDEAFFATWLTRILINECKAIRKKQARQFPAQHTIELQSQKTRDEYTDVQQAVDALPEKLRLPVVLHYIEGYPQKEVAQLLSVPVSTIKNRLLRARQKLRLELDHDADAKEAQKP